LDDQPTYEVNGAEHKTTRAPVKIGGCWFWMHLTPGIKATITDSSKNTGLAVMPLG
jgi:hypothetical protein